MNKRKIRRKKLRFKKEKNCQSDQKIKIQILLHRKGKKIISKPFNSLPVSTIYKFILRIYAVLLPFRFTT